MASQPATDPLAALDNLLMEAEALHTEYCKTISDKYSRDPNPIPQSYVFSLEDDLATKRNTVFHAAQKLFREHPSHQAEIDRRMEESIAQHGAAVRKLGERFPSYQKAVSAYFAPQIQAAKQAEKELPERQTPLQPLTNLIARLDALHENYCRSVRQRYDPGRATTVTLPAVDDLDRAFKQALDPLLNAGRELLQGHPAHGAEINAAMTAWLEKRREGMKAMMREIPAYDVSERAAATRRNLAREEGKAAEGNDESVGRGDAAAQGPRWARDVLREPFVQQMDALVLAKVAGMGMQVGQGQSAEAVMRGGIVRRVKESRAERALMDPEDLDKELDKDLDGGETGSE